LLFDYVATYMYEGDTPNAERRAAALALDRDLLRELLGQEELRELLDPEALADLELSLGRHAAMTAELGPIVTAYPLREALRARLLLALFRSGRQTEALENLRAYKKWLAEEAGLDPCAELAKLEVGILRADPRLERHPDPGAELRHLRQGILSVDPMLLANGSAVEPAQPSEAVGHTAPRATTPAQLPGDVAAFTGRANHLRQLDERLPACEPDGRGEAVIAAIVGPAGVGKTSLVAHWAYRIRSCFPDGQLYVDLQGPGRPIEALTRFLHALDVPAGQVPVGLDEAAAMYRTMLADKQILVVLDNARDAEQVRPLLPAGPGCLALVTGREDLSGLGARVVDLDVLDGDEADALLLRLLGEPRLRSAPGSAAELIQLCGCLPLALRIAAARLLHNPDLSIEEYVSELRRADEPTAPAIEVSYAALAPDIQRLFRLIALAPGPEVTAEAAAALTGFRVGEAATALAHLCEAHLVERRTDGRFAFHDLLRQYAATRTRRDDPEADRQSALQRLFDWYLSTVDAAATLLDPGALRLPVTTTGESARRSRFDSRAAATAWLDAERLNLVAAVRFAAEHGPRAAAWQLADALRAVHPGMVDELWQRALTVLDAFAQPHAVPTPPSPPRRPFWKR